MKCIEKYSVVEVLDWKCQQVLRGRDKNGKKQV